jgi:hypothetical protein
MRIKNLFLISMVCVSISVSYARTPWSVDSLKSIVNKSDKDTSAVNNLIKIAKFYYRSEPDSTLKYAQKALIFSNNINYSLGKGKAYRMIGLAFSGKSQLDLALNNLFSALTEYKK